jgi:NodT family efflux transporter outer membrane factor (OMF) lipoprotein
MNRRGLTTSLLSALLASACAGYGDIASTVVPADPVSLATARSLGEARIAEVRPEWWRDFGDPQLDLLVDEALHSHPGLKVAEARLASARAFAGVADAQRMPQVSANFQGDRQRYPQHYIWPEDFGGHFFSQGRLALDFSYEIDFWGRNRAVLDGALSYVRATEVERDAARLILAVAVVRAYVELDRLCMHRDLVEQQITARRKAYAHVLARSKAGLDEQSAVARFAALAAASEGELPAVDQQLALVRHQLAVLLGAGPDRGLDIERPKLLEAGQLALPSMLPADLLGRRPDVVAQRYRVEAADKFGEAARADFYPNVDLFGFLGSQALGLPKLLESGSSIAGFGAAARLPIYGGGRLRAQLRQRYAEYDIAVADYNAALTEGLKDIANAVSNWRGVEARDAAQRTVLSETANARNNARQRYQAGLNNELNLIEREMDLLVEQRRAADVRAQRYAAATELNRALGGGLALMNNRGATQTASARQTVEETK